MRRNQVRRITEPGLTPHNIQNDHVSSNGRRNTLTSDMLTSVNRLFKTDFGRSTKNFSRSKSSQGMIKETDEVSIEDRSHDNANFTLCDIKESDGFVSSFGQKGGRLGEFQDAKDVEVLSDGRLLLTDHINSRIQICNTSGKDIRLYSGDDVIQPWSSVITRDECVAFTSCRERCVVVLNADGDKVSEFGRNMFIRPTGIAVDGQGRIIVTDASSNRVSMHSDDGTFIRYIGDNSIDKQRLSKPQYVCVSSREDIIVSDSGNHSIKVYDRNGDYVRSFGSFGKDARKFKSPHGVCINSMGEIFVADHYNSRISAFTRDGMFIRHIVTSQDGLVHPQGVSIDSNNRLYVTHGHLKASEILMFQISKQEEYNYPYVITHV